MRYVRKGPAKKAVREKLLIALESVTVVWLLKRSLQSCPKAAIPKETALQIVQTFEQLKQNLAAERLAFSVFARYADAKKKSSKKNSAICIYST